MAKDLDWGLIAAHVRAWVDSGGNEREYQGRVQGWVDMSAKETALAERITEEQDLGELDGLINFSLERSLRLQYGRKK